MSKFAKIAAISALVKLSSATATGCGKNWEGNLIPFNLCSPAEPSMDSQYQAYTYYCDEEQNAVFGLYFVDAACTQHVNVREKTPPECEAHDVTIVSNYDCNITNLFESFNCEQDCEHYEVTDTLVIDYDETKDDEEILSEEISIGDDQVYDEVVNNGDDNYGNNDEGNDDTKTIIIYGIVALFIFVCLFCSSR